ncbi:MAG: hypothetical protein U1A78_22170 [Polyangia bacterium]
MARRQARIAGWLSRLFDRLARSSRVFLLSVVIACGVEVLVDWNQTLFEINVLRDQIRQKGLSYAGLVLRAGVEPLRARDQAALGRLGAGILDDDDAIFVRITDAQRKVVYEQADPAYEQVQARAGRRPFRERYAHLLDRDLRGVTDDIEGFKQRLLHSRYRDFPQVWTDTLNGLMARFAPPPEPLPGSRRRAIAYQDRLRDDQRRRDNTTTWAVARIEDDEGRMLGGVIIAFDMARINASIRMKYLKGLGVVLFFVALILVQNVLGRRDKLRLLDLEARYAQAKERLRGVLPAGPLPCPALGLTVAGALSQARGRVDGVIWDAAATPDHVTVLLVDPDGDGIDAAAIALHVVRTFRARRSTEAEQAPDGTDDTTAWLRAELSALGAATLDIPLTRPIGLLLVRLFGDGRFVGVASTFAALQILNPSDRERMTAAVTTSAFEEEVPPGVVGPLLRCSGELVPGATLLCSGAGRSERAAMLDGEALVQRAARATTAATPAEPALIEQTLAWARLRHPQLAESDLALVSITRAAA